MQSLNLNWCSDLNDWVQLFVVIWNCYVILPLHTKNSFSRHVYRVIQRKASNCPIFSKPCMIDLYGFESYNLKECSLEIVQRGETQWAKGNKGCGNSSRNFTFFFLPVWILIWRFHVDLSYRVLLQIGHSLRSLGLPMPAEATFCM